MDRMGPDNQDDGEDIPERVKDILDPRSINPADIESDDYDGTQSVEEYLRSRLVERASPNEQTP